MKDFSGVSLLITSRLHLMKFQSICYPRSKRLGNNAALIRFVVLKLQINLLATFLQDVCILSFVFASQLVFVYVVHFARLSFSFLLIV